MAKKRFINKIKVAIFIRKFAVVLVKLLIAMEEIVDIVDQNDRVIGKTTLKEAHREKLLHRAVHVVIENSKGEVLCLKRAAGMKIRPSWTSNMGEHVHAAESYEQAATRGLREELGITAKPVFFGKILINDKGHNQVIGIFKEKSNGPFNIDRDETERAEFRAIGQIRKGIATGEKYTPTFVAVLEKLYGKSVSEEEIVDLINKKDAVIGQATRNEVKSGKLLYRCAGIYVEKGGKILLEKRSAMKTIRPGNWSIVEETVKSGESYEQAAIRGVREELGLEAQNLKPIGRKIIDDREYPDKFMLTVFRCNAKGRMRLQKSEVEKVQWVTPKQAQSIIKRTKKISPGFAQTLGLYTEATK